MSESPESSVVRVDRVVRIDRVHRVAIAAIFIRVTESLDSLELS